MNVTIKINGNDLSTIESFLNDNGIEFETILPRLTKGQLIFLSIVNVVESGEFKSRKQIANEIGCTVSRISEITKEYADSDYVIQYEEMTKSFKTNSKNEKELAKAMEIIANAQKLIDENATANVA